jgi:catalase
MSSSEQKHLTSDFGIPTPDNTNSLTVGYPGPTTLEDFHLVEKLAHFNRERIPERIVHAKGAGAYGYFEVTNDVTGYTKADFLNSVGKQTPVFVRFSTVGGEKGSADSARDPRGFAIKFYTQEGNYDLVGNNTPVFFIRDAIKFPDLIHTQKRNPATNLRDADMFWDFFSLTPESLHQVTILFSSRGTPRTYRNMDGFGSHTFSWTNQQGESFWVKYHFKTESGIENWTSDEATQMAGENPDYATQDLFDHIASGKSASWKLSVQLMPIADAANYRFDPFDVTKVWPHADYPLISVGRLVLDRNPENYFAEVEQAAFAPTNIVPGIGFSPDKMLQGRIFAYPDAHRYRVGPNYALLPVNKPAVPVNNYRRDGAMRFDDNGKGLAHYEPNSLNGPVPAKQYAQQPSPLTYQGQEARHAYALTDNDFVQPGNLYRLMSAEEKTRLVENIVGHMKNITRKEIAERQVALFSRADAEWGAHVAQGLGLEVKAGVEVFANLLD